MMVKEGMQVHPRKSTLYITSELRNDVDEKRERKVLKNVSSFSLLESM